MFYAHFVLSKKGPLARIWLAAHWDKKLSKAHVFETDVEDCCDSIIHPKVKMALRTTGHLLLGVVRIHSRKAKYLLADCNEAFVKIKMAFRPGVVDLPEENREAAFAAITLPEVFHDFDSAMPEINDAEVQKQFTLNQSRVEEITMKEDLGNITLGHDDGFGMGDLGFDHSVMRDAGSGEDSLYKHGHDSTLLDVSKKGSVIDTSLEKQMDIDLDQPIRYDGFGGQIGTGDPLLGDGFMTGASDLFDEQPEIPAQEISLRPDDAMSTTSSVGKRDDEQKDREATIAEIDSQESSANKATSEETAEQHQPNAPVDQTTLVANEEEAFALEPLDVTGVKETRHRRKRKLIVDEVKELAGDIIKAQLKDTSDIVTTLDLAPPTKKLMLWKETGGAEKLFVLPGRLHAVETILRCYTKNLTAEIPKDLPKSVTDQHHMDLEEPHIPRQKRKHSEIDIAPRESLPPAVEIIEPPQPVPEPELPSTSNMGDLSFAHGRRPSSDDDDGGFGFGGYEDDDDDDDVPAFAPSVLPPVTLVDEAELLEEKEESSSDEEDDEETTEERTERKLNKRATQMLNTIKKQLEKEEYSYFGDLVRNNNKKQVAAKFYSLLVLKKQQDISVEQIEPFADIRISRGPGSQLVF
ncbi:double-strand-break repair protein rad21 homolog [Antedon mediterranea]|uniref:double-strand-break repair protein rad21 homolog n=1 Tax=Antedon mediterranea TaxID=105859 RepID=UPI003AF4288A